MEGQIARKPRTLVTQNREFQKDNFSKLPDELVSHILSLMPTKFAVQTSILSRRWRYRWTTVTSLDFDHDYSNKYRDLASFVDFVDRVLRLCKSSQIRLFRLRCGGPPKFMRSVDKWIAEAIRLNPSQLVSEVYLAHRAPLSLFTCKTLTTLKLNSFGSEIPSSVYLPNLKILSSVGFIAEELLQMFIDGCPILEDLSFDGWISNENRYILNIRAPAMKRLGFRLNIFDKRSEMVLNAPNLEYLNITSKLKIHVENLQSLVEASIHLDYCQPDDEDEDEDLDWRGKTHRFIELLRGVSGVRSLSLHFDSHDEMNFEEFLRGAKLPTYYYLTSLEMVFPVYCIGKFLPQFLEISPNLKYLSLKKVSWHKEFTDFAVLVQFVSCCSLLHLEEIKLKGFQGSKNDLAVVEYLLGNAKVLKRLIVIGVESTLEWERVYYKELLKLKKAAGNCKFEFHGHHVKFPSLHEKDQSFQLQGADASLFQLKQ